MKAGGDRIIVAALIFWLVSLPIGPDVPAQETDRQNRPQSDSREDGLSRLSAESATVHRPNLSFERAAARNLELQSQMIWSFGGKSQRGWYLYAPLISTMIGAGDGPADGTFAMKLSIWQGINGLPASGVLDQATWLRMVANLQSARISNRSYPDLGDLITAPVSDFYDLSRPEQLRKVERRTYAAYKRMLRAAANDSALGLLKADSGQVADDEPYLKIISAFRSREYQEQLRKRSPGSGRAGLAINSPHFTGRALDLYVGGAPVNTSDANRAIQVNTRAYRWLLKNASRFGFKPYFYEPWHWEYVAD